MELMRTNIAIAGRGAVTPAGCGVESLLGKGEWKRSPVEALVGDAAGQEAYRVDLGQERLKRWQEHPRLRRASPISFFLVEAARQALDEAGSPPAGRLGIVVAMSTGCIVYTRKFLQGSRQDGRRFASPQLFPETVYNAPASHLAHVLGAAGGCYTQVGDDSAWTAGLRTAACWLGAGAADAVLVAAAEEIDAVSIHAFRAAGWFRAAGGRRFVPAEGAGAVVLRRPSAADRIRITALCGGQTYRNRAGARAASGELFDSIENAPIYPTAQGSWLEPVEREWIRGRAAVAGDFPACGQAFCASAAWHTLRAAAVLGKQNANIWVPIWGLNHELSALQVRWIEKES